MRYAGIPASTQLRKVSTRSAGHAPSHGIEPSSSRLRIACALSATSSRSHRSKRDTESIVPRSLSRNSGFTSRSKLNPFCSLFDSTLPCYPARRGANLRLLDLAGVECTSTRGESGSESSACLPTTRRADLPSVMRYWPEAHVAQAGGARGAPSRRSLSRSGPICLGHVVYPDARTAKQNDEGSSDRPDCDRRPFLLRLSHAPYLSSTRCLRTKTQAGANHSDGPRHYPVSAYPPVSADRTPVRRNTCPVSGRTDRHVTASTALRSKPGVTTARVFVVSSKPINALKISRLSVRCQAAPRCCDTASKLVGVPAGPVQS